MYLNLIRSSSMPFFSLKARKWSIRLESGNGIVKVLKEMGLRVDRGGCDLDFGLLVLIVLVGLVTASSSEEELLLELSSSFSSSDSIYIF